MTKQILYIGLAFLSAAIFHLTFLNTAYSTEWPASTSCPNLCGSNIYSSITYFQTSEEATTAYNVYISSHSYVGLYFRTGGPCEGPGDGRFDVGISSGCDWTYVSFVYAADYGPAPDTDNDGLPDDCDFYPDDPTPYSVKLLTYFTDDGTESGNATFQIWQTDRGDLFEVGEEPSDLNSGFYVGGQSTWSAPECGSEMVSGPASPSDPDKVISQPTVGTGTPSGDAPENTDPTLKPGKKSDGTETGDAALRDIIDNTGDIASNTKRLGEYAKDLNTAIQNMDRNLTIAEERAASQELEKMQDELDAESGWAEFTGFDVEGALSGQINPEITEGPDGDYQDHGPLYSEPWVTEFISTNPISTVLGQSGFQYTNSRCTADLDLGYLGQHSINICHLEPQFITFGQLLVALVTLTGLIHVVTGRGF